MHIHILGICGTFMGGVAALAKAAGHKVTGQDAGVYPPMSTQLEALGIELTEGYDPAILDNPPDIVVVGNAMSRGNPVVEAVLNQGLPYTSGPQWLAEHVLRGRHVLAVAGTHGKTTTASMLAWILEYAGLNPGFLIGGVPGNFSVSARLGHDQVHDQAHDRDAADSRPVFVVEADEYDTAFFDKRSKFVHYLPRTLVLNNLEFDHADIFPDLAAIQRQFHHLIRTVPGAGQIITNASDSHLDAVLAQGCWTPVAPFELLDDVAEAGWVADGSPIENEAAENEAAESQAAENLAWQVQLLQADGGAFAVRYQEQSYTIDWPLLGKHNVMNGTAAMAAACHAGVSPAVAAEALSQFAGVKRRCEICGEIAGVTVYDDFAHHPTAIATTLQGLRAKVGEANLKVIFEPRSNTMQMGIHQDTLAASFQLADEVWLYAGPDLTWSVEEMAEQMEPNTHTCTQINAIVAEVASSAKPGDHVVIMSNGGFGGIHGQLLTALEAI